MEYKRRVQHVFAISQDWPKSEPRGLVVNLVASLLSPPYTKLNMDPHFDAPSWPGGRPTPGCSLFRVDHPESLHDHRANTFEKPSEHTLLEQAGGISFKPWGGFGDEASAGGNINEWHLLLGHYSGERKYMYMRNWSWAGSPPEVDHEATVTLSMVDVLSPSDGMQELLAGFEAGVIRIPQHLSASEVLEFVKQRR